MGSTRVRIAAACGAIALLGGVACGSGDGDVKATGAETPAAAEAATPATAATTPPAGSVADTPPATDTATPAPAPTTPAEGSAPSASAPPTAEDIQALIATMTAQLQQAASGGPETPAPTSDEIKAQLLEQLRQLGITL